MSAAKRTRWHYSGDVNIENGGFFYDLSSFKDGYANVVRVQPCADAGGPGNCYWIEQLTVNTPVHPMMVFSGPGHTIEARRAHRTLHFGIHGEHASVYRVEDALRCIGFDQPDTLEDWDKRTMAQRRHIIVYACVNYGLYDQQSSEMVQLGRKQDPYNKREGEFKPDKVLRANASLRNYVRNKCE